VTLRLGATAYNGRVANRYRSRTAATLVCGLAIAGCGSSAKPTTSAAKRSQFIQFSQCMRAHGVPNFPDPKPGGGGIEIPDGSGIKPFSPAFKSAQNSCRKLLPGGGPTSGHPSAQAKAQMLAISQCMRRHGITDFPDPTVTAPSGADGYSAVLGRDGVFLAIPQTVDMRSPAFEQAANKCGFGGRIKPG
jgi:hypothetical protein